MRLVIENVPILHQSLAAPRGFRLAPQLLGPAEVAAEVAVAEILRRGVLEVGLRSIMGVLRATDLRFVDPLKPPRSPQGTLFVLAKANLIV